MIEMTIKCPECDAPVHVDGPYRKVFCRTCQSEIEFPEEVWGDFVGDITEKIAEFEPGEGSSSNIFGHFNMTMTYGNLAPREEKDSMVHRFRVTGLSVHFVQNQPAVQFAVMKRDLDRGSQSHAFNQFPFSKVDPCPRTRASLLQKITEFFHK